MAGTYSKYFVGYGNNFPLVKQILKQRWWLSATENSNEEVGLVWTSWRKQKFTDRLPTYEDYLPIGGVAKKIYGRMEDNYHLSNKKGILLNLKEYYRAKGKDVFES